MQKTGGFLSNKISENNIITSPKIPSQQKIFHDDEKDNIGCKIIISVAGGKIIRDRIIKQNSAALEYYVKSLRDVSSLFNAEKKQEKNSKELDPKKINKTVYERTKKIESAEKIFLKDVKNIIQLGDVKIKGKLQLKKIGKIDKEMKEQRNVELNCILTSINPYEKKIYFRIEGVSKSDIIHNIDTKYLCFESEKSKKMPQNILPKKTS